MVPYFARKTNLLSLYSSGIAGRIFRRGHLIRRVGCGLIHSALIGSPPAEGFAALTHLKAGQVNGLPLKVFFQIKGAITADWRPGISQARRSSRPY